MLLVEVDLDSRTIVSIETIRRCVTAAEFAAVNQTCRTMSTAEARPGPFHRTAVAKVDAQAASMLRSFLESAGNKFRPETLRCLK